MKIKKGDTIVVIAGKDNGKRGKVESVSKKNKTILVPELNTYKRHVKKNDAFPQGGVVEISRPIVISKVALVCPKCDKPTRVGFVIQDKLKKRMCKKCKAVI